MVFIVIDGTDGAGKGTQTDILIERLTSMGKKAKRFDFPRYGKPSAALVEQYLRGEFGKDITPKQASILFAIDRFAAKDELKKALDEGIVISNRYVSSNMGHQAGKIQDEKEREAFLNWLDELEYDILGLPRPDISIFLDVPPELGQKLVDKKGERK